jgi:hypothetical protein
MFKEVYVHHAHRMLRIALAKHIAVQHLKTHPSLPDFANKTSIKPKHHHTTPRQPTQNNEMFELAAQPSHMGHGTYPRATKLRSGLLLGVHTAFENGENVIVTTYCPALSNGLGCSILDDNLVCERFGEVPATSIPMSQDISD